MKSFVYVVKDLFAKDYGVPFVSNSDSAALSIFYSQIHNLRNTLTSGYKQYSYYLYCLGELDPDTVTAIHFSGSRLVAVSNFVVEEEN